MGDDDALGTVDDEGALLGHHGEVAHEDALLLDLARLFVGEAHEAEERRLVGHVLLAALIHRMGGLEELVLAEGHLENVVLALDGARFLECLAKPLGHEALEGFLLHGDEVGQLEGRRDLPEVEARALGARSLLWCGCVWQALSSSQERTGTVAERDATCLRPVPNIAAY